MFFAYLTFWTPFFSLSYVIAERKHTHAHARTQFETGAYPKRGMHNSVKILSKLLNLKKGLLFTTPNCPLEVHLSS